MKFSYSGLSLAVAAALSTCAMAQDILEVTRPLPISAVISSDDTEALQAAPASDGGDLLRTITGVSGSRMGGRGIDPVVRGQKQNQLNIILDGAYLYGGCPNRMDPPTTYTAAESYDRVTVIKGNRSVIHGPGGSGGTLLFERERPVFDSDKPYRGQISAAYIGNSDTANLSADLATGSERGYVRFITETSDAGNYDDGNGDVVRSSYQTESNALLAGFRLADRTWLEASYDQVSEDDVLFPGAGMDSPYSDSDTWRLKLDHSTSGGFVERVRAEVYRSDVNHLMDNYSLRTPSMMMMAAPTSSDTTGGRLLLDSRITGHELQWGMDHQENSRDASAMIAGGMMAGTVGGIQWPDVTIKQTGLFGEISHYMASGDRLKVGARYDLVRVDAGRTDEVFTGGGLAGQTPNDRYGANADDSTREHNLSGFVSWTHRISPQYRLESTVSRSVRTADATERYMATSTWIGNPSLDPEQHHQLELVLASETADLSWSLAGYYNRVDDYINRTASLNATGSHYENIDADLYGLDFELVWQINENLQLSNGIAWVKGRNRDDNTHLSQIPPLTATLALDYRRAAFKAGVDWEIAAQQNEVCLAGGCNGLDVRKTPGYGVLNLNAGYDFNASVSLAAGVNNLFDKAYAYHLNREDALGNSAQVNEPGRTGWMRLTARF
ncbi:TonB-dependent copper receptor [Marinobacterium sediminicola]|uniref:Iron complex outermembrane recepter protein n=1 Tax=Marinobacterium sediminicola TaxID=518898 RepID=A0ABY1S385_9GAMM|nr:TonB-dependent copper receptor [Marinobacterium sediminicola]ULG68200.1 TonB-dependent copper receptor [Marinobacterium sediminicola]SMR77727.1 iron complex outermembrane recepter protein [Marinobacterium sediminicola]